MRCARRPREGEASDISPEGGFMLFIPRGKISVRSSRAKARPKQNFCFYIITNFTNSCQFADSRTALPLDIMHPLSGGAERLGSGQEVKELKRASDRIPEGSAVFNIFYVFLSFLLAKKAVILPRAD